MTVSELEEMIDTMIRNGTARSRPGTVSILREKLAKAREMAAGEFEVRIDTRVVIRDLEAILDSMIRSRLAQRCPDVKQAIEARLTAERKAAGFNAKKQKSGRLKKEK